MYLYFYIFPLTSKGKYKNKVRQSLIIFQTPKNYLSIIREFTEILIKNGNALNEVISYNVPAICFNSLGISRGLTPRNSTQIPLTPLLQE